MTQLLGWENSNFVCIFGLIMSNQIIWINDLMVQLKESIWPIKNVRFLLCVNSIVQDSNWRPVDPRAMPLPLL